MSAKRYFDKVVASLRTPPGKLDEAAVEKLLTMGYTVDEIRQNARRASRGERVQPPKNPRGPLSCRTGSTGFKLCVYDGAEFGGAEMGKDGKYAVVCEEHNTISFMPSLALTRRTDSTDFCEECMALAQG